MTFEEYYKNFGFKKYPFGVYTSEGEVDIFNYIYLKPQNHSVILESLKNTSAIVTGERGTGKTALSLDLAKNLSLKNNIIIRIEEFSNLKLEYNTEDFYKFLIEHIAAEFFMRHANNSAAFWKYNKEDRVDLSMYLHSYLGATTKALLRDKISKLQNSPIKRFAINLYNVTRTVLNYGLKAATKTASDALTKHFSSLPEFDLGNAEYFKKIESDIDESFTSEQRQYFYLEKLCKLVKKSEIEKIYIIIDKIDEDSRFQNDAENIADYIKNIVSNNTILTSSLLHLILFLWSTPFNHVKDVTRTQKLSFSQLAWDRTQLELVLQKRLSAYSDDKITNFKEIFSSCNNQSIDLIFSMCNRNPRDLWHIMDKTFQEQYAKNPNSEITDSAVSDAIEKFVKNFNYYEYYPKKSNARANTMDIYKYIKHLLKLGSPLFTKDRLNTIAGTGGATNNYVSAMENMGLIKNSNNKAQGGAVIYEIIDPKINYAISRGISIGD